MKILHVGLAVAMVLGAGSVYAGGCEYGHADSKAATASEDMDPRLLALLKKQEQEEALQSNIPNVPN